MSVWGCSKGPGKEVSVGDALSLRRILTRRDLVCGHCGVRFFNKYHVVPC